MAAFRLPGLMGVDAAPLPWQRGTMALCEAAPPGLLGASAQTPTAFVPDVATALTWDQIQQDMHEHEALITHLYLDSVDKVTVGVGNMLPTVSAAQALAFVVRATPSRAATAEQIQADWDRVVAEAGRNKRAAAFAKVTLLDLPDSICWGLLKTRIDDEFLPGLKKLFPTWEQIPTPAKRALLDMAYNLGLAGLKKFKTMRGHVHNGDWQRAAQTCSRTGIPDTRNQWTAARFEEAGGNGGKKTLHLYSLKGGHPASAAGHRMCRARWQALTFSAAGDAPFRDAGRAVRRHPADAACDAG